MTQASSGRPAISRRTLRGRRVEARRAGMTPRMRRGVVIGEGRTIGAVASLRVPFHVS